MKSFPAKNAAKRKGSYLNAVQRKHLLDRVDAANKRLDWPVRELKDPMYAKEPPEVKAARALVKAYDQRKKDAWAARIDALRTLTVRTIQWILFEPQDVAIAGVEQFEALRPEDFLDADRDLLGNIQEAAQSIRAERAGLGPSWDR